MKELHKREVIIKTELERILNCINESKVFNDDDGGIVGKLARKMNFGDKSKDERLVKNFLMSYYLFLGAMFSNDIATLYSKSMRKSLITSVSELKKHSNPRILKKIPKSIVDVINTTHSAEEVKIMTEDFKSNEKDSEKFSNILNYIIGKQIGCINRGLCLDILTTTKTYNESILILLTTKTIKLIDFVNRHNEQELANNYDAFFDNEVMQIDKSQDEIAVEIGETPELKSAFFNFWLIRYKMDSRFKEY